jgi:hypothetical protein
MAASENFYSLSLLSFITETKKETINSGSAEYSVAAPPIDTIADEEEDSDDDE